LLIQPTLLSIAGSDPSGGAGIQADLKTMTSVGVYGAAALTCLTVQNSHGVQEIKPLGVEFVQNQIRAVLDDHDVTHIKIGMTGSGEILQCLAGLLRTFTGEVIYDPVLASSTGESLLNKGVLSILINELLKEITYLTPNKSELEIISGDSITNIAEAIDRAMMLLSNYPKMKGIVVKGGHLEETNPNISDFLVLPGKIIHTSKRTRRKNPNLHGTGCTYSSALASYLCLGNDVVKSFQMAGAYMDEIIHTGENKSAATSLKNGPLLHFLT
jgi:hydroxymethylpyrimidine/phosphomethylpyrimidine kinase